MLRVSKVARLAAGMAIALSLVVGGFAQPMAQGLVPAPQVPERLPELIKAIATELNALWDKVEDMPALKEALSKPMALAKDALEALKEAEGPGDPLSILAPHRGRVRARGRSACAGTPASQGTREDLPGDGTQGYGSWSSGAWT